MIQVKNDSNFIISLHPPLSFRWLVFSDVDDHIENELVELESSILKTMKKRKMKAPEDINQLREVLDSECVF